jgi:hypothetical protein
MSLERGIGLLGWLPGSHDYARLLQAWKSVPLSLSVQRRRRLHRPRWPTFLLRFYGPETLSCVYRKLDSTLAMVMVRGADIQYDVASDERNSLQRLAGTWLSDFAKRCRQSEFSLVTYLAELQPKADSSGG